MYSNDDFVLEILEESGWITKNDVQSANPGQGETKVDVLIQQDKIAEMDVARAVATNLSMEFVDLSKVQIPQDALDAINGEIAWRYKVVPLGWESGVLVVVIIDPLDFEISDSLRHVINQEVDIRVASPTQVRDTLRQRYGDMEDLDTGGVGSGIADEESTDDEASGDDAPIIRMVTGMLIEAFKARASDIHLEPLEAQVRVRYRIDGVLHEVASHPKKLLAPMVARIKIMTGSISIAEKRLPQDGRIQLKMKAGKEMDLRVSTIPSNHGESVVMRILDKSSLTLGLPKLGFFVDDQETFESLIGLPDGIIMVTGPTGSGKTTTLYACLNHINKPDRKIITVEDPVEYQLGGINQVQVKEDVGMTFDAALRAILRQAPNIIMIGEIRDKETANIAINASLTGHLVFSTLHTNDAPSAVARMVDIGVKPFLIASAVRAILAQRLVRKLCDECKAPMELTDKERRALRLEAKQMADANIMGPIGCDKCRETGFRGRMGIFEFFVIDDEVRHMVNENLSTPALRKRARELGMRTLREDGIRKVLAGSTSASEIIHATMGE